MLNYRDLDWQVIGAALLLSLTGVLLIMSAQHHAETVYQQTYFLRQLTFV